MPIYEYRCKTCKKDFEVLQKMSDSPLAKCPSCGKNIKRLISRTSFALKGGGWYKDGYTGSSGKPKTGIDTGTTKTEAKTEAKAEKTEKKAEKAPTK